MNTNARTFRRKTAVSQTAYDGMRIRAGVLAGARRATAIAKHTIVRTGETPSRSERIQTPKVVQNWTMTAVGTSRMLRVTRRVSQASARPTAALPATITSSDGAADCTE